MPELVNWPEMSGQKWSEAEPDPSLCCLLLLNVIFAILGGAKI